MCLSVAALIYVVLSGSYKQAIERVGRDGARKLSGGLYARKAAKIEAES